MSKIYRLIIASVLIYALGTTLYTGCIKRTKGFSLKKIQTRHAPSPNWVNLTPKPTDWPDFSKPLHYIGSGKKVYAFATGDGKYVVKFFKQKRMDAHDWMLALPVPSSWMPKTEAKIKMRKALREKMFASFLIAYHKLQNETGTTYLHLGAVKGDLPHVTLIDRSANTHKIDLNAFEFLIQKRGMPLFSHINSLLKGGETESVKDIISELINNLNTRRSLGLADGDLNCKRNYGWDGTRVFKIDIEEYAYTKSLPDLKQEFDEVTADLKELFINEPELLEYLQEEALHVKL